MIIAEPGRHFFTDKAAKIPCGRAVGGAHQRPDFQRTLPAVGHLKRFGLAVPQRRRSEYRKKPLAEFFDFRRKIDAEVCGGDKIRRDARPVLERTLQKVGRGQHQPPQVPQSQHDVREGDLFDAPPLSLRDDDVVDADRLGNRELNAREDGGDRLLRRKADDDSGNAYGGQQRRPDAPEVVDAEQDDRKCEEDDQRQQKPLEDDELRLKLSRMEIVGDRDIVVFTEDDLHEEHRADGEPRGRGYKVDFRAAQQKTRNLGRESLLQQRQQRYEEKGRSGRKQREQKGFPKIDSGDVPYHEHPPFGIPFILHQASRSPLLQ